MTKEQQNKKQGTMHLQNKKTKMATISPFLSIINIKELIIQIKRHRMAEEIKN